MPVVQVKKVVAVCFLEAAKLTTDNLAAHRLEMSQKNGTQTQDVARLYGEARRLRDYMQRCTGGRQEQVELDLSPPDQTLLVACCRRAVDAIEHRLQGEQLVREDERHWLLQKRQMLADWAVELATKPLLELPLPRVASTQGEAGRALLSRLQTKLFGDVNARTKILAPSACSNSLTAGVPSFGEQLAEPEAAAPPDAGRATGFAVADGAAPAELLVVQQLRDPRLRVLAAMDLRTYNRALESKDNRLSVVMLAAVLEAAVLDHAIPRRSDLGLTGTPDTWNPQDILVRIMGDAFTAKDKSLAYHLFSARNLLRPALQIVTPTVVTPASLERLQEFAQRALHHMGFGPGAPAGQASTVRPVSNPTAG